MTPTPLRIFLVDDEAPARSRLRELLGDLAAELPNEVVGEAANGQEGLALLPAAAPDVVLVDIQMPQMNGMEFARHLAHLARPPAVVFVTAHDQYAIEAFEVNALDYLLKPVRAPRLAAALGKAAAGGPASPEALARASHGPRRYLSVGERGRILLVPVADVLYMKAELKYVTLRTSAREHLIEESLTSLEQEFGALFVRVHRNCLVARRAIRGFERTTAEDGEGAGWAVLLHGCDERLPVSRRQWAAVKAIVNG
ncbi:MAG: LytTR family DNA-binding domain-containing protein [Burkholderiales bacterium]|nr:LytTR family DNA-binding domain-containing protein [Burkholderiales bacterium]